VLSGIAGLFSGPLADRHGRVVVIYACLFGQVVLTFANLLMTNFLTFAIVRGLMFIMAGLALPALIGQIRDLTPRVGRASGYGFAGLGAPAANWIWTFVPGVTLSHSGNWKSEIWIMSIFGVALFLPIVLWMKDLSVSLRLSIFETESSAASMRSEVKNNSTRVPATVNAAFAALLRRWDVWVLVVGAVLALSVPITMQTFGPLMFVQVYKYTPAEASKMASYFFLAQTIFYFPAGYLSDSLRMRKVPAFVLSALLAGMTAWWAANFYHGFSPSGLAIVNILFGGLFQLAFVPWLAFYSEYLEDIDPALQATGWSFYLSMFRLWLAAAGFLQPIIAQHYGWAAWIWLVALTIVIFMISLVIVPGYWRRPTSAVLNPAPAH
jgi:MFS family permease